MAISGPQAAFPEVYAPLRVFVPIEVGGVRYDRPHADRVAEGIELLGLAALREGVVLIERPAFKVVHIAGSGDVFLVGEQHWH